MRGSIPFTRQLCSWLAVILLLTAAAPSANADSVLTTKRTVTKVATGIYVIRHPDAPDTFPQGNTTVIIGDKSVFVVDACYLPSSAREDIAQIRTWTKLPVRWLLNTHWHYDHTMGNGVYAQAFPDLSIIAHRETAKQMAGYNPGWFERFPGRATRFQGFIDTGKDADGKDLSDSDKRDYAKAVAGIADVQKEFKALVDRTPNMTFDSEMTIDLGHRIVQIKHLGRGNTAGDAVAYLPVEKILIAGDLLDHPVPYLGGGFPAELVTTLHRMSDFDAVRYVPGHGDVLEGPQGRAYLGLVTDFVSAVVAEVSKQVHLQGNNSRILDDVQAGVTKALDIPSWRTKFVGTDKDGGDFFDSFSYPGLVKASFAETWRR